MALSPSRELTEQFYRWEIRGRGWHLFPEPVDLEPAFEPFFGHFTTGDVIDDGRRKRWWQSEVPPRPSDTDIRPAEVQAYGSAEEIDGVAFSVTIQKGYPGSQAAMEQLLTVLAMGAHAICFEIIADATLVSIQLSCGASGAQWLRAQLGGLLPGCSVAESQEDRLMSVLDDAESVLATDFGLAEEFMRPIAAPDGRYHDPYAPLFAVINHLQGGEALALQVIFQGARNPWAKSVVASVADSRGDSFFYDAPEMPSLAREKVARPLVAATLRVVSMAGSPPAARALMAHAAMALKEASRSPHNSLVELSGWEYDLGLRMADIVLRQSHRLGMLLNVRELATLAHIPSAATSKKLLGGRRATRPAPAHLDAAGYVLGLNEHQGRSSEVGIDISQRTRHVHILGGSGTGKSTLLHSLISQDIRNGTGCCVIDPHGDLIESVLRAVPQERIRDVVLIDPSDGEFPVGLNILSAHSDLERELLASDLVSLFKRFSTSWGDNLHSVLANAIMAFLYNTRPGHLGDLRRFLIEPGYRATVLETCTDEGLLYYWRTEYPLIKTSSIGSILTRLDGFLRPRAIRNMVCQREGLDFGNLMDTGKIILVNLSHGTIGAENSHLLGACIVARLQQCAMARQQQRSESRVPFFCYIDEMHNFVTESMGTILSSVRKFNFGLVLAHQDMQQAQRSDADVASALMSNVATRICFRLSDTDARRMHEGFEGFATDDLQNLAVGEAVARVNTPEDAFNISVRPMSEDFGHRDAIVAHSRQAYGNRIVPAQGSLDAAASQGPQKQTASIPTQQHPAEPEAAPPETREHRYLQGYVKALAEQHGYRADIEVPTPGGNGLVDVAIERDGERGAFEISVSTTAAWELHNVRKCLAAGYGKVVVCAADTAKLRKIRDMLGELPPDEQGRVVLLTREEIPSLFRVKTNEKDAHATMKGYRVRVTYGDEAADPTRAEIIRRIVGSGKR